jgi:hypothetical protein
LGGGQDNPAGYESQQAGKWTDMESGMHERTLLEKDEKMW